MQAKRLSVIIVTLVIGCAAASYAAFSNAFTSFTNGFSSAPARSTSYMNLSSVGQNGAFSAQSESYRSYAGVLSANVTVNDAVINFIDETPSSTAWQDTTKVSAKITIEIAGGNGIGTVKYRVSSTGPEDAKFSAWQSDSVLDTTINANKAIYRIDLTTSTAVHLSESEDNYIQWKVRNTGGFDAVSGKYRIRVRTNDAPAVVILQPDEKGGIASQQPMVQARITDQYWGVNPQNITIRIDRLDGVNAATMSTAANWAVYDSTRNLLSWQYNALTPLSADTTYRLTVTAADRSGLNGSASVVFTAKGGAIADLVPYPSPFDPKKQPVTIRYVLNKYADVSVNIYDMSGRLIRNVLENVAKDPGIVEDTWDGIGYTGEDMANGVYFCEIVAKDSDGEHRRYTALAIFAK